MKKKNKYLLIISIIILLYFSKDYEYNPNINITPEKEEYADYSKGRIFIGDNEYLKCINKLDGDILIEDQRNRLDSNMKIYDSYLIKNKNIRNEILEVINCYENNNESSWDRSIESMRLEWFLHNLSYELDFEPIRSKHVDLNNEDENKYNNIILRKIFKL